jgi:predicted secreted protein
MNNSEYICRKEEIEIKKVEDLFGKLAEYREKLKSGKKEKSSAWEDGISNWAIRITTYSFAPIIACLIAIYIVEILSPKSSNTVPQWIPSLIIFSSFFSFIGMLMFFVSLVISFVKTFKRDEKKRAQETFTQIQPYLTYGAELSREFNLLTLEKAQVSLRQEITEFNRRGNSITVFLQNLPSALWWIALFIVFNVSLNAQKLQEILAGQNVSSYNKFQEVLSNFIFSNIISHLSPLIVLDIIMYALVITLMAKSHPILITTFGSRRSKRYEDYSRLIEQAKEFRKDMESKAPTKISRPYKRN